MVGGVLFFVAVINLASPLLRDLPYLAQRSVQWALIERDYSASASIQHSSTWRLRLFMRALDEWRSESRIFWFGRATYGFGPEDYMAIQLRGDEGLLEVSLRRGATHNLITDHLVVYGLVGLVIYLLMTAAMLKFLWKAFRSTGVGDLARAMALSCFLCVGFHFTYAAVGGWPFPVLLAWMMAILLANLYFLPPEEQEQQARRLPEQTWPLQRPRRVRPLGSPSVAARALLSRGNGRVRTPDVPK